MFIKMVLITLVNGIRIQDMDMELWNGQTVADTKDSGEMICIMVKAYFLIQMEIITKVSGTRMKNMVSVKAHSKMGKLMKVFIKMGLLMDMDSNSCQTVISIQVILKMENTLVMEITLGQMGTTILDRLKGVKVKNTALEFLIGLMVNVMMDSSLRMNSMGLQCSLKRMEILNMENGKTVSLNHGLIKMILKKSLLY